jgi:hypothetical protein
MLLFLGHRRFEADLFKMAARPSPDLLGIVALEVTRLHTEAACRF